MTSLRLTDVRIFLCATPIRMNYSFDTLMGLARSVFDQDPLSGHLFLFFNRDRNRVKILFWDSDGFCIWYKRLERGTFEFPRDAAREQGIELTPTQLSRILGGLDLKNGRRRRRRYRLPVGSASRIS
jgi:transposase